MTPTVEWQVAGACNYDCSYCIQSRASRRGRPDADALERAVDAFATLPGIWELKLSGGEAFAHPLFLAQLVPALLARTSHRLSVLTNLSASDADLDHFVALAGDRLEVVSASLHLEFTAIDPFLARARRVAPHARRFVVNQVVLPHRLDDAERGKAAVEAAGFRWFPQLYKVGGGVAAYPDEARLRRLIGEGPGPREANLAPSYHGRLCRAGVDYFTVDKDGAAWSCRSARRKGEGALGNVYDGSFRRWTTPRACPYRICPCTVPANRGMIEGIGA